LIAPVLISQSIADVLTSPVLTAKGLTSHLSSAPVAARAQTAR